MESDLNYFFILDLPKDTQEKELSNFFTLNQMKILKIEFHAGDAEGTINAKIHYNKNELDLTAVEDLEGKQIGELENTKFRISFIEKEINVNENTKFIQYKENENIRYNMKYENHCTSHFVQSPGDSGLTFVDLKTMEKQRGVLKHVLSKLGTNLMSGTGIMNVSLPINIFDERSLLEVLAHQSRLSPYFLEKAGQTKDPIDKLKLTTAFGLSQIHMSVTQLKPFNPIWGETFQCKIGNTKLYMEQTSHHPPIFHFYHVGENFKAYGYQQPVASTGANSVSATTLGSYVVEYPDGTKHKILPCSILISGTLIGSRTFAVTDKFFVIDEKNDYIAQIEFNPDDRGSFGKFFSKRTTFPDFFKGCITKLSQTTYKPKENTYVLNKNCTNFVDIKGEWSKFFYFDDELVWNYNDYPHYDLKHMKFTLPSDSTLREDLVQLKNGDEEAASEAKTKLEEIQRHDRKLRGQVDGRNNH